MDIIYSAQWKRVRQREEAVEHGLPARVAVFRVAVALALTLGIAGLLDNADDDSRHDRPHADLSANARSSR